MQSVGDMRNYALLLTAVASCALAAAQGVPAPPANLQATVQQLRQKQEQLQEENADLQRQINELRQQVEAFLELAEPGEQPGPPEGVEPTDELEALRRAADAAAGGEVGVVEEEPGEVEFRSRGIARQALNPEISVTGDMVNSFWTKRASKQASDFNFRGLGLHFESYLDPYTRFKAAVGAHGEHVHLGEAYFTRFGLFEDSNLTLGKFRQQFGVVNRWHKHGLDQVDFPLPLRSIFGEGGLNQTGLSLDWNMPSLGEATQQLTVQVTDAENARLFGGSTRNCPATLVHYKNYRDLSKDTYLDLGLTALAGKNDQWSVFSGGAWGTQRRERWTTVLGADLTILWEPTERMRYRNFMARGELYYLSKGILAPDGSGPDTLRAWGFYTDLQSKICRTVDVGVRTDYFEPDTKPYASMAGLTLAPLAVPQRGADRWLVAPYLTWWQSPWVKYRIEYDHGFGNYTGPSESRLIFQAVFSAGPHRHERY